MADTKENNERKMFMTQVAIVIVGVLVSGAFYGLTNLSIGLKLTELEFERAKSAENVVRKEFDGLEKDFTELVEYVKLLPSQTLKSRSKHTFRHDKLSSIFWIETDGVSLPEKIIAYPLFNHYSRKELSWYLSAKNIKVIRETYKSFSNKETWQVKSLDITPQINEAINMEWENKHGAIVLGQLLRLNDGALGLLNGISDTKTIFNGYGQYENLGIAGISIKPASATYSLHETFYKEGGDLSSYISSKVKTQHKFSHADFNRLYKVRVDLHSTNTEKILAALPWIVLTVSLFLTFVYTAIRHFNISRAQEMQELNQGLASRNIALKNEIKKREKMNLAVRQSEQENRAVINSINEVIFELDVDGNLCFINDTWRRVTGHDLAESIGKPLFSFLREKEQREQIQKLQDLVQGKSSAYCSLFRLQAKDGHYKPVEMTISMLRQDQHKNLRVVGTLADLEEKELAEKAVVEAEENYKRIWKNAANGIYELDLDGALMSANPAMADILGYDDTDQLIRYVTNMSDMIYVTPEDKAQKIKESIEGESSKKYEIKAYRKDGEEIWLNEFIQPVINDKGVILHLEGTIDDITDRKNADIALMKAKAESDMANRAKSDFLANMSHELRTPLNSIMGFAEIIRDQVMGAIKEPAYTEYAGEIHKSGKGLLAIINQILDVSKIESGDRELNESLVKLAKLSDDSLQLFTEKIREKQIEVTNNIDDSVEDLIAEDRSVKQMLYNLLSNAVKFTPNKGKIILGTSIDENGDLRLFVEDNGEGLTPEQVERALKPFDLLDGDHSRETYGAGLGLTLVKLLMDMHGGRIDMQSEKNVGTTVSLIFPKERIRSRKKESKEEQTTKPLDVEISNIEGADVFDTGSNSVH
ncbi:MAG: PAS domain S-box protein [Alphaproteobacteria bacterium]|nr:PAS domain S-box protein [Alphaproteobacteria bacterium]